MKIHKRNSNIKVSLFVWPVYRLKDRKDLTYALILWLAKQNHLKQKEDFANWEQHWHVFLFKVVLCDWSLTLTSTTVDKIGFQRYLWSFKVLNGLNRLQWTSRPKVSTEVVMVSPHIPSCTHTRSYPLFFIAI